METNIQEVWRDVVGYEGFYQVSDLGRVKSLARLIKNTGNCAKLGLSNFPERILRPYNIVGYLSVKLTIDTKFRDYRVHRLVLEAFVGPSNGLIVDHKNEIKTDNRLENLRYCTARQNTHYYHSSRRNENIGVVFQKGKWTPRINVSSRVYYFGRYSSYEEANKLHETLIRQLNEFGVSKLDETEQLLKEHKVIRLSPLRGRVLSRRV